jgi:hypothetical protein
VRALVIFVATMAVCCCAGAQISFAEHYALAKEGKLGSREAAFAKQCGVDTSTATLAYGISTDGGFDIVKTDKLANTDQAVLDQFGSAQMWSVGGRPRLLNVWFMFVKSGYNDNEMICMTPSGHMSLQETLTTDQPAGTPTSKFIHVGRYRFPANNKRVFVSSGFLDSAGKPIPKPNLTAAELQEIGSSSRDVIKYTVNALSPGAK